MKINVLARVLGDRAVVGLVGLLFGDEGQIEIAQQLDSERLLAAVNSEANMDVRLKKASVLIATLKTTREKLLAQAKKAATKDPEAANVKLYASQIADLDGNIATLQASLDKMTAGRVTASRIVDKIQTQVQTNLVKDQITLTKKEFNAILEQQVEFTADMITALPSSQLGGKLRKDVERDVEETNQFLESKLDIFGRMLQNQGDDPEDTTELDEAGQNVMNEILGK